MRFILSALMLATAPVAAQQPFVIPEDAIANVRARVDGGWAPSVIIGVVDAAGTRYFAYGNTAASGGRAVNERTVYEIGSITKVFTGTLLADMAIRGEVSLDDSLQRYLPAQVRVPASGSQPVTLRLLSAQRSGLPRMPNNFAPSDPTNPYADYDTTRLYQYLATGSLARDPGSAYEYSNLGVGLLGLALGRRSGGSYERLVTDRIIRPLGMTSTMIALTPDARSRLAAGSADGRPAANWDLDALAGAGAIRSTAADMTRFLAAAMGLTRTPLDSAFRLATEPQFDAAGGMRVGLGWHIRERNGMRIVWHNGGTGGYRSWAGYDPARRVGIVVLTNSGSTSVDDLGVRMFDSTVALQPVPRHVVLPAEVLDEYVGRYPLTPTFVIEISRVSDGLNAQATNQPAFRIYASERDEFFLRVVVARISFTRTDGRVTGLILRQNGRDQVAPRER